MTPKEKAKELIARFECLENNTQIMYETGFGQLENVGIECKKKMYLKYMKDDRKQIRSIYILNCLLMK